MKKPTPNHRLRFTLVFLALIATVVGGSTIRQRTVTARVAPTVSTDKSDYSPGETVTISGSGWQAGETVTLTIYESDGDAPWQATATADGAGSFSNRDLVIQDHDGGVSFALYATGSSGDTATAAFTDSPPHPPTTCSSGTGQVSLDLNGNCTSYTAPSGNGPGEWEVLEGKSYTMTISGVTECSGDAITVWLQGTNTGNFSFNASKTADGVYVGTFTMPNPACFTYPIGYVCGADQPFPGGDDIIKARGPDGSCTVHLRAATFDSECKLIGPDEDCNTSQGCLITCPADKQVECGDSTLPAATGTPTVTGDCTATYEDKFDPACGNTGVITRTWSVTGADGIKASCDQKITVVDTTAPTIGDPGASTTIDCPNTPVFTPPTASDSCGDAHVIEDSDNTTPGSCANTYSRTKTWHAEDDCGNKSKTVSQTITVQDKTPPTIGNPGPSGTIECPATPQFTAPTASDSCGTAHVIEDSDETTPGSCLNTYSRTKTWHAEDDCGNKSGTVSQTITVVDTTPPTIGDPGADATIYCPNQPVFTPPTASDSCGSAQVVPAGDDVVTDYSCGTKTVKRSWYAVDACGNKSGTVSQTITVECNNCGGLTMGFWQNKNGQGIIKGGASTAGVANSGTWLRQFAPFQDLSATATAAQVATYVTNVIKAANAGGASMNAMLKAQMLATALDVYFSDPALGGNQIGAPAPLGGVHIDLTHINKPIGSANYEDTSSAFGGINCQTVLQLLTYAASQSNAGGSTWYGQVKATQELAKDTFDAINNNVAFACP